MNSLTGGRVDPVQPLSEADTISKRLPAATRPDLSFDRYASVPRGLCLITVLCLIIVLWLGVIARAAAQPDMTAAGEQPVVRVERSGDEIREMPGSEERFSLAVEQLELAAVLGLLAAEWGLTLMAEPLPADTVSLTMNDVSLEEALGYLLHARQLDFRIADRVLRVAEPDLLAQEDDSRRRRRESMLPLETVYLQVNYADAEALASLIRATEDEGLLSWRGSLQVDVRTNTLIVRDVANQIVEIERLLQTLDVPVSQVLIEARIVSASLDTGRELGVRWGMVPLADAEQATQVSVDAGHRQATQAGIAILRNSRLLEWEISALEHQGEAELIARPRIITQDNTQASIRSGVRIPYQAQAGGTAGGSITEFVDAVLSLQVTPLITPDNRIVMQLHIQQDAVASGSGEVPAINTNTIETHVLIDDNDTLVLGGIFREEQVRSETGTPLLRRLPGLGRLFSREVFSSQRTELLIFITPRIIELGPGCC